MVKIDEVIKSLSKSKVDYVIIGELVTFYYGWKTVATKFDLCYSRSNENIERIVEALSPYDPRPRDFPIDLPFIFTTVH